MATVQDAIAQLDQQIRELTRAREVLANLNGAAKKPARRRGPRTVGKITIADAAERALKKVGEPMRTKDLLAKVRAAGAACGSTETLYKTLMRSPRFKKAGKGEWTVAG